MSKKTFLKLRQLSKEHKILIGVVLAIILLATIATWTNVKCKAPCYVEKKQWEASVSYGR
jgi:hypothetical protein